MNTDQFAFFKDRYSRMSDEELANLLIGRHERLSEEANAALTEVLKTKDPAEFMREVDAKVEDLNGQARAAAAWLERQAAHSKRANRAMAIFFGIIGVIVAIAWVVK